jgi:hypothetical protein
MTWRDVPQWIVIRTVRPANGWHVVLSRFYAHRSLHLAIAERWAHTEVMMKTMTDLANLLNPLPRAGEVDPPEALNDALHHVEREQQAWLRDWELQLGEGDDRLDPLLTEIRDARRRIRVAEQELRLLIAYGRDFARPRPYKLEDLAEAAGYSVSGIRTAYGTDEVAEVMRRTGTTPRAMDRDQEMGSRPARLSGPSGTV